MATERENPVSHGLDVDECPTFPSLSNVTRLEIGGMGTVFRVWQDDLERAVAVKTQRADLPATASMGEQFKREAHVLAQFDHPSIVPVYYASETERGRTK